jgi:hypothetical protein
MADETFSPQVKPSKKNNVMADETCSWQIKPSHAK